MPSRELRAQVATLCVVLFVLALFGRDWLRPTSSENSSAVFNATSSPSGSGLARQTVPPASAASPRATGTAEKLPLGSSATAGEKEISGSLEEMLPPLESAVTRRELPFDCPSATGVRGVAFLPDAEHAMTIHHTERGGALRKWSLATGAPVGQPAFLPRSDEYQLTFSPDGNRLAMTLSPAEQGVLLLNAKTGAILRSRATNHLSPLTAAAWGGDGSLIYGTPLGTIEKWLIVSDASGFSLSQGQRVTRVAVSDAGYALSGDQAGEIRLWSLSDNGRYAASYRALKSPIRAIETRRTPDGVAVLAVAGEPGESWLVHVFDLQTQKTLHSLTLSGPVVSVAVAPDWRRLVSGRRDGVVTVWDTISGDELESTPVHFSDVTALAVAPDNSCVMSGCYRSPNNRDVTVRLRPFPPARIENREISPATEGTEQ